MKTTIDVKNRQEGELLRAGLNDPTVRAFVKVAGALVALPTARSRERVLRYMADRLNDPDVIAADAAAREAERRHEPMLPGIDDDDAAGPRMS